MFTYIREARQSVGGELARHQPHLPKDGGHDLAGLRSAAVRIWSNGDGERPLLATVRPMASSKIENPDVLASLRGAGTRAEWMFDQVRIAAGVPAVGRAGADPSGAVQVVLGTDGLPASIRVEQGWERVLSPQLLGAAVGAAYDAARAAVLVWALPDTRGPRGSDSPPVPVPVPVTVWNERLTRALAELAEDMVVSLKSAGVAPDHRPDTGTGEGTDGRVSVTLSRPMQLSCRVDPRWAQGQSAAGLSTALGVALSAARTELPAASARGATPAGRFGPLLDEVMGLLQPVTGGTV